MKVVKKIAAVALVSVTALSMASCEDTVQKERLKEVTSNSVNRDAYIPQNDVEFNNYNKAQELFDNPATIIWCSAFPSTPSAPIITVPIAGKLTSSSSSYFSPERLDMNSGAVLQEKSVDGMYHGSPPPYRFGFTPGGQYVSFEGGMDVVCTTSLTQFQKDKTYIQIEEDVAHDQQAAAEEALSNGDHKAAQDALKNLGGE